MLYVKTYLQAAQKWLPIMTYILPPLHQIYCKSERNCGHFIFVMILLQQKKSYIKSWKNITVQISNDKVLKKSWNSFSSNMCFENKCGLKYLHDMFLYWITVVPLLKDNPFCNDKKWPNKWGSRSWGEQVNSILLSHCIWNFS